MSNCNRLNNINLARQLITKHLGLRRKRAAENKIHSSRTHTHPIMTNKERQSSPGPTVQSGKAKGISKDDASKEM
jgi:hypothetical protein|uniref:Uncharacterized protein n=1 Tax=Oryza sativa subsp. japonica TaxID=39947 RepID=Q84YL1_ORYSJ|nr:hypothetical protein [Oryza sativa Japonica Group]